MSRSLIFRTLVLLAVTAHVSTQYVDFFQSFIQSFPTTKRPDVTKRTKPTTKPRYQDTIFFETDFTNTYRTTAKPRRKPKTTTTTKSPWYQESIENNSNNVRETYNTDRQNNNRHNGNNNVNNNNNNDNNNYEVTNAAKNNRQNERRYDTSNSRSIYNSYTTINPLLNRPGVRPAVVDDNRPPITNRPVTVYTQSPNSNRPDRNDDFEAGIDIGPDEDSMTEAQKRRYMEIAEQKCDEYKSLNTKKVVALPLATLHASQGVELNVSTCTPINIPLIIGGKVVSIQEFPHMTLVGWKNIQKGGYSWKCGGSLISEQFILTAGHCTYYDKDSYVVRQIIHGTFTLSKCLTCPMDYSFSGPPSAVQLGSSYIDGRDATIVSVASVIRHPKFKLRRSYYDVALLKMITTVRFSNSIMPACLGVPPPEGERIIATGWGRTEFGGDSSAELRSVSIPIWDMGECRNIWGTSLKLPQGPSPASQLCAGEREGGRDTCQGDSGGPAQVQDGCTWRVVAVTSVGRSCGAAETPALYAKLPRAFIASQIFANVNLNNNNRHNENNNRYNGNNNRGNNGFNNQNANGQTNGNNRFGNTQNEDNNQFNSETSRPSYESGDSNNRGNGNTFFVTSHASENSRKPIVSRPGNHQTIDYNRDTNTGNNFFVTSHTAGNGRKPIVSRPGNHQTIETENRDTNTGGNFFVTSHTAGNTRAPVRRPGNHQTIQNKYSDSQNSESNSEDVFEAPDNKNTETYNNNKNTYSNYGSHNSDYGTTESPYNNNNNRYNEYNNNNRDYLSSRIRWNFQF